MDERCGLGLGSVPNRGIASETCGRVSATRLRNTVSDSRIVTPEIKYTVNTPTDAADITNHNRPSYKFSSQLT